MRTGWILILASTVFALFTLMILIAILHSPASATRLTAPAISELDQETGGIKVFARRVISPTFGIDPSLNLFNGGQNVLVSGHGECGPGGDWFTIRFTVTSSATRAIGRTEGDCPIDGTLSWEGVAEVRKPTSFEEGPAEVCASAVVHFEREGAVTQKWCKEVELVER